MALLPTLPSYSAGVGGGVECLIGLLGVVWASTSIHSKDRTASSVARDQRRTRAVAIRKQSARSLRP